MDCGEELDYPDFDIKVNVSRHLHDSHKLPFQEHVGKGPFGTWLGLTLPSEPARDLLQELNGLRRGNHSDSDHEDKGPQNQKELRGRGEAHITVLTPPEIHRVLRPAGLNMDRVHEIALAHGIQNATFTTRCLGRARVQPKQGKGMEEVYFLVVDSPDLVRIRWAVWEAYVQEAGGEPALFAPEAYWPHVTVGYTLRDYFPEDGVWKGVNSCWAEVNEV
ncbi:MAG: hypothetical protein DHS80DRAFT_11883 [Piptocephalis tieghemiana]|nr:MAG: hypothetical protein DHS80DRAFT_11883 [Piptocephalis tieghemiana]